jgi:Cu+-exporting ATPase
MAAIVDMGISRTDQLSLLHLPAEKLVLLPSPRYPSMPRFAVSRPHCNIDETEIRSAIFKVEGMVCAACAGSVEKAVKRLPGIEDATVALLRNKAQVFYRPAFVEDTTIREAIEDAGFEASIVTEETDSSGISIGRFRIGGMTCTSCSNSIEVALNQLPGVKRAGVGLATEECEVEYDSRLITHLQLMSAITDLGYTVDLISAGEERNKVRLHLNGLNSQSEVELIMTSLKALPGVKLVDMASDGSMVEVAYDPNKTGPRYFIEVIEQTGPPGLYMAKLYTQENRGPDQTKEIKYYRKYFFLSCVFTVPVFLLSMVFMYIPGIKEGLDKKVVNMLTVGALLRWILSTPVQFVIGRRFYIGAYNSLRHGSANMDVLIAFGTNAAYFYSVYAVLRSATSPTFKSTDFFETSAMLISFILLGKFLEVVAKGKTSEAISKLMNLAPVTATLLTVDEQNNVLEEREISSQLIQRNDIIKVVPGSKIPTDGVVEWGQSFVNESMITGEARPVSKKLGDKVIGGTMNGNGVLRVKATHVGAETALSQIVRLVEAAQMAKAPVQKLADRISKYFVPLVVIVALLTFLGWYVGGKTRSYPKSWIPSSMDEFELALQFGISVLVVACPCALGLATPTAVMVATGKGASQGVLIKGGQALEGAHKVKMVVFDKTGTLTIGKPVVVNTNLYKNMVLQVFYEMVAAAEVICDPSS